MKDKELKDFLKSKEFHSMECSFMTAVSLLVVNENMSELDAKVKVIKDVFGDLVPGKKIVVKQKTKNGFRIL